MSETTSASERPFHLEVNGARLYCVGYEPGRQDGTRTAWVMLNPLDNEAECSIRFYVRMARLLVRLGHPVLRFDYFGTGNSSGSFEQISMETLHRDIEGARTSLERSGGWSRFGLIGARFGGALALHFCACSSRISEVIIWDPVLDLCRYVENQFVKKALLNAKLAGEHRLSSRSSLNDELDRQGKIDLGGCTFSRRFFTELTGSSSQQLARPHLESGLLALPDVRLATQEQQLISTLEAESGLEVVRLEARRGRVGWGTESFSERSPLVGALQQATVDYLRSGQVR